MPNKLVLQNKKFYRTIILLMILFHQQVIAQNFPKLGVDTSLDVANWNIEWFGDVSNGPSDEATQYANVKAMIEKTDMDVFALAEISNGNTYNTLSNELSATYDTYISTFSQTQKTGIYWKKSMFKLIVPESHNLTLNSSDNYNFASRPPLQVCLQTLGGSKTDTLYFIILHMKAYSDQSSYDRRLGSSVALKTYLESSLPTKKYIVLGDWNDDLDQSIFNSLESPYKNFLTSGYTFPSKELTDAGKSSYAFSINMIDHQLISKAMDSFYFKGSARVFDLASNYCTGFSNNTSDHFPVYAFYDWKKLTTRVIPAGLESMVESGNFSIFPNPSTGTINLPAELTIQSIEILNLNGQLIWQQSNPTKELTLNLSPGLYFVKLQVNESAQIQKLLVQ